MMRCFPNRLDPTSFSAKIEWSLRTSLTFLISALCALYFKDILVISFLLPILVLVVTNPTFGHSMKVSQAMYRGSLLTASISTIFYFVPIIGPQYWYLTLIYFFMVTLFLTVTLHTNAVSRKLSLAYHVIYTLFIAYKDSSSMSLSQIWEAWLLVPLTIIIVSIGMLIPFPIFAYQQLLFVEQQSIATICDWLRDIIQFSECKSKIQSKIQLAKLRKYAAKSSVHKQSISTLYPHAKHHELIDEQNEMLNEQRMEELRMLHSLLFAMYDAIQYLRYDTFHQKLLHEIKDLLITFTDYLCQCLQDKFPLHDRQTRAQLMRYNEELLGAYEAARIKLLFADGDSTDIHNEQGVLKSVNAIYSFFYFLQTFTDRSIKYLELYSDYEAQKEWNLHCSLSLYEIFYPFPFTSWQDFKDKASPLIHWKSDIFIQSLAVSLTMAICGLFFIYPTAHNAYKLGFWSAITVAFVSDTNVGGTFHTSILRLEGTFLGVTCGFIILQLQDSFLPELYGIFLLTVWVCFCGYYRSHPSRGYSGLVAAFTASLIVIGYDSQHYEIAYYSIRRIEMTFIGIALLLLLLQVVSPNNARKLLQQEMMQSLKLLKDMFDASFHRYKIMIDGSDATEAVAEVKPVAMKSNNSSVEMDEIESKSDADLISNEYPQYLRKRASPNELYKKFRKSRSQVTKTLDCEKILISASVFEPMLWKPPFNDALHFELHEIQRWILRRVSQIELCLRSLLVYIERSNESEWLLNEELVHDITPFVNYLQVFAKCHNVIISSMECFIGNGDGSAYEDVMLELEMQINERWVEFDKMLNEYLETKHNPDQRDSYRRMRISLKGALVINALMFAVKNLMSSLSEFAECKISY